MTMFGEDEDKTEQPTALKVAEARSKGQVAYSPELSAALAILASFAVLKYAGSDLMAAIARATEVFFSLPVDAFLSRPRDVGTLASFAGSALKWIAPFFACAFGVSLVSGLFQVGFHASTEVLEPNFSRLNPLANFGRLFSKESLIKIVLSVLKMSIVGTIAWVTLAPLVRDLPEMQDREVAGSLNRTFELLLLLGWRVGGMLLVVGVLDVFFRRWRFTRKLMMSKEEVKEEERRATGDPKIKGRIRDVQKEMARRRMRTDVRRADVVIRNPTHFAVALKYESKKDPAPRVVAKGADLLALQIVKIAVEAGVMVVENKPLAREIHRSVRLGDLVPERLFKAVAQVLAMVYRKKRKKAVPSAAARAAAESAPEEVTHHGDR